MAALALVGKPMRFWIPVLLSLSWMPAGADTSLRVSAVEIVGYGIFTARETRRDKPSTSTALAKDSVRGITFTKYTAEIPALLGTTFGIQYLINSSPRGSAFPVTCVIIFPEGGLVDPRGRVYRRSSEKLNVHIGRKTLYGYGFDRPWELVPGEWVFQIWHKDIRLAQKKFTVSLPEAEAET